MALLIHHAGLSILVQLLPPPSRRSVTPGFGAHCKLAPFVLQNMFCFYTTRIAYYLTSSAAGRGSWGGELPQAHRLRWEALHSWQGGRPARGSSSGKGPSSCLPILVTIDRALGLTLPGSFMSAPSGFVALGR